MYIYIYIYIYISFYTSLCPAKQQQKVPSSPQNSSLPEIRRQRVFKPFSVPGVERLRKLLSAGPQGYMFSKHCSKSNNPKEQNMGRNFGSFFL